jgi:catechol 2,3-dioxygenase-like lactoylglutathione lyase family enzyme
MIRAIRHAAIVVTDMDRSLAFYCDLLGLRVVLDAEREGEFYETLLALPGVRLRVVMLEAPDGNRLELFQFHSHPKPAPARGDMSDIGASHVAFRVDDVDATYAALQAGGFRCNCPPIMSPDGYGKVVYCHDSDGTVIEIVQIMNPDAEPYKG